MPRFWLDVANFLGQLDQANTNPDQAIVHLRAALDLYGGEFLAGFHLAQAVAFDEWQAGEREWLHRRAVEALYAAACASEGNLPAALDYLQRLIKLEPWHEEAHRQLMRLLALNGQRSDALAQYATCRRVLQAELGVEPAPETRALYEQILRGQALDGPAAWEVAERAAEGTVPIPGSGKVSLTGTTSIEPQGRTRAGVPSPTTALIGRDSEMAQGLALLRRPGSTPGHPGRAWRHWQDPPGPRTGRPGARLQP